MNVHLMSSVTKVCTNTSLPFLIVINRNKAMYLGQVIKVVLLINPLILWVSFTLGPVPDVTYIRTRAVVELALEQLGGRYIENKPCSYKSINI